MCAQPCLKYYAWQIETMLYSFEKVGINQMGQIQCLFAYNTKEADWEEKVGYIKKIEERFRSIASFYYYEDSRVSPYSYISGVRPNIMKQHFKEHKYLSEYAIFYHDCDVVFTKTPYFLQDLAIDDENWYVSDTISYIGYEYIVSKGEQILEKMCDIVGTNKTVIKERQNQSGGAQYFMKGVDWMFFEKVEQDAENLFKDINAINNRIKLTVTQVFNKYFKGNPCEQNHLNDKIKEIVGTINLHSDFKIKDVNVKIQDSKLHEVSYHEIQIWCADMWAVLWNAWMRGYKTQIVKELDFCWATDHTEKWDEKYIYHNAGATVALQEKIFYKGAFQSVLPYGISNNYEDKFASYKYFELVQEAGNSSALLEKSEMDFTPVKVITIQPEVVEPVKPKEGLFSKVKEIAIAYATAINPTDEEKAVAEIRLETCITSGADGGYCEELAENKLGLLYCKKCGCATKGKIYSPKGSEACPLGKWTI
jgi:hypothetical protein